MADEKIYIYDDNYKLNVFEESSTDVIIINPAEPEVVYIYEQGNRGPKGQDGGSYIPPSGIISGSEQLTSSFDSRYERLGTGIFSSSVQVDYNSISNIPSGIISSSEGFVLSNQTSSFLQNNFTSSYNLVSQSVYRLEQTTASFAIKIDVSGAFNQASSSLSSRIAIFETKTIFSSSQQVDYNSIQNIPIGIISSSNGFISSSNQLTSSLDSRYERTGRNIISSSQQIATDISGAFVMSSSSLSNRLSILELKTLLSSSQQVQYQSISNIPVGIISSSNGFISGSDQLTSSFDSRYERKGTGLISSSNQVSYLGITNIPSGIISSSNGFVSSSNQLATDISGSINAFSASIVQRVVIIETKTLFSSSQQVDYNFIQNRPSNLVSSSQQIANDISGAFGLVSSSLQSRISIFETKTLISSSQQINTGSFSGSFSGNGSNLTNIQSSSYALTASYALNGGGSIIVTSSLATTGSNTFIGNQIITGSLVITQPITGSIATASFAPNIQTIGARIISYDSFISEGSKGYKHIGYNSQIIKVRGIANTTGSINLNIKRNGSLLGNYALVSQTGSIDSTLSGWTVNLYKDDLIEFYVSQSSTYITDLTFFMDLQSI